MASNLPTRPFGSLIISFDRLREPVKESDRRPGPFPYYGASGAVDRVDRYIFDGTYLLVAEDGENLRTRQTPIAFMATGQFWVNNHAHVVQANTEADIHYLMYALGLADVAAYLTGSTMPKLTAGNLARIPIPFRPLHEQRCIAEVLGALDDKIELNRKMSATLEAIARALFKSWFVDFDPVRAKAEGRDTGLPSEIATLFPDSFEKSELGEIPKGWLASKIGKHLETVLGGTPDRGNAAFWNSGNIAWINSGKVNEFRIIEPTARITQDALEHSAAKVLPPRTTVLAITGATLGQVSLLEIPSAANQSVVGILGTGQIPSEYIYNWISERIDDLVKRQTGGAQQHVNRNDVNDLAIIVPPAQIMDAYGGIARPVFDRIKLACLESKTLSTLRNTLLPKLISGDIRVPDAQRFVETFA